MVEIRTYPFTMTAVVSGYGEFPLDMLRRDCAYPATPDDVATIANSFKDHAKWTVRVSKIALCVHDDFNTKRWESFGCHIETEY